MRVVAWGHTDPGRKRDQNQDNYLIDDDLRLYIVADGMGGHQGGETASRMAVDVVTSEVADSVSDLAAAAKRLRADRRARLLRTTQPMDAIDGMDTPVDDSGDDSKTDPMIEHVIAPASMVMREAAREAGQRIFDAALEDPALRGMGTTLTAMLYARGRVHLAHAGDSRAYLFRDNRLEQLTDDHSWIAEQIRAGTMTEAEAKESKFRHIITRSVGFERDVEVDHVGIPVEAGDCFLLCSDGMTNYVENDELETILQRTWHRRAPRRLIDLANERGGDDNITVVVVCVANHTVESDDS